MTVLKLFYLILSGRTTKAIRSLVVSMQLARSNGQTSIARKYSRWLERFGVFISSKAVLGHDLRLPHPTAIVIGEGVVIGNGVTIYQCVTLGGRVVGDWKDGNYPSISDGCVIFAGAVIAGKVSVGRNCVIGANSVVLDDIPDNSVAVGAPARVVKVRHVISR